MEYLKDKAADESVREKELEARIAALIKRQCDDSSTAWQAKNLINHENTALLLSGCRPKNPRARCKTMDNMLLPKRDVHAILAKRWNNAGQGERDGPSLMLPWDVHAPEPDLPRDTSPNPYRPLSPEQYIFDELRRLGNGPAYSREWTGAALYDLNTAWQPKGNVEVAARAAARCSEMRERGYQLIFFLDSQEAPELWENGVAFKIDPKFRDHRSEIPTVDGHYPLNIAILKTRRFFWQPVGQVRWAGQVDDDGCLGWGKITHYVDPLRPPLWSMKLVADMVEDKLPRNPSILIRELGRCSAAMALSVFLPQAQVYSYCDSLRVGHPDILEEEGADLVVLGLPGIRAMTIAGFLVTRTEDAPPSLCDFFDLQKWDPKDGRGKPLSKHVRHLVDYAISRVSRRGFLAIVGEQDLHFRARKQINGRGDFEPHVVDELDTVRQPAWVRYCRGHASWVPGNILRASERLVSLWRRTR